MVSKDSILFELREINRLMIKKVIYNAKKGNQLPLSPVQVKIINYLLKHRKERVYQRDLENVLNLRRSTISGILQTMEKNNIIRRVEVAEDARVKQIILTEVALKKDKEMKKRFQEIEKIIRKKISKKDLETFLQVTTQIKENLKEGND